MIAKLSKRNSGLRMCLGLYFSIGRKSSLYSEYVYDQLYHPRDGYFTKFNENQLGRLPKHIPFNQLLGYSDYTQMLIELYPKSQFLTPSEIFRPFYGMSLANLMLTQNQAKGISEVNIIEVGSGLGGNANSILNFFKNTNQEIYKNLSYTLIEISPISLEISRKYIEADHPQLVKKGQIIFENVDVFNSKLKSNKDCYVILLEILDNLPHDKIRISRDLKTVSETWIEIDPITNERKETFKNLENKYIKVCFEVFRELYGNKGNLSPEMFMSKGVIQKFKNLFNKIIFTQKDLAIYLPTGFYKIAEQINANYPKVNFILSDFCSLPLNGNSSPDIIEINPPIISTKMDVAHESKDYKFVFEPAFGTADIFFPTDFELIRSVLESVQHKKYNIESPEQFFEKHADTTWARTRSDYNPMFSDFANTRFLYSK